MPCYTYRITGTDELIELTMTIAEMESRQFVDNDKKSYIKLEDGRVAKRVLTACGGQSSAIWPRTSTAAGVAANQVAEATATDIKLGVPTDYTKSGDAIYRSPTHQRKHLRAHGLVDRDSYI